MPAAGGPLRVLRRIPKTHSKLEFSSNGKRLLVIAGWAASTISTLDVRTGRRLKISPGAGELLKFATWSEDGRRLAYMADLGWSREGGLPPGSPTALFTIRPDGSGKRRIATISTPLQGDTLSWKADVASRLAMHPWLISTSVAAQRHEISGTWW